MLRLPGFLLYRAAWLILAILSLLLLLGFKGHHSIPRVQTGIASFYDEDFEQQRTASGKPFDPDHFVAAHPHYPLGTVVRVTNLQNDRSVNVQIIDRGPNQRNRDEGVIIDLSRRAAERLGFKKDGRTRVRTEVLKWGRGAGPAASKE